MEEIKEENPTEEELKEVHKELDQRLRQARATAPKYAPLSLDINAQTATFKGSSGRVYETSLYTCTCRDYSIRQLPCKHMYRLAQELGIFALPPSKHWGGWPPEIHSVPAQKDRIYCGAFENLSVSELSETTQTAKVGGFLTSLSSCECRGFHETGIPCKHIYCLAIKLHVLTRPERTTEMDRRIEERYNLIFKPKRKQ